MANVFRAFGGLEYELGNVELAQSYYENALKLYRDEQEPMGLAYSLAELIRCHDDLDVLTPDVLANLAIEALEAAQRCGVDSVEQYVYGALHEVFGQDRDKLEAFIASLG